VRERGALLRAFLRLYVPCALLLFLPVACLESSCVPCMEHRRVELVNESGERARVTPYAVVDGVARSLAVHDLDRRAFSIADGRATTVLLELSSFPLSGVLVEYERAGARFGTYRAEAIHADDLVVPRPELLQPAPPELIAQLSFGAVYGDLLWALLLLVVVPPLVPGVVATAFAWRRARERDVDALRA